MAVPTAYDAKTQTLVALVPADPDPSASKVVAAEGVKTAAALPAVVSAPAAGVNTLAAGASGSTGDYRASGLSPAGQWSHGGSSGSFQYKYPFELPKTINGAAFPLALTYDSGSVDGMSQATNNQASWVGLGWDLPIGSIERRYKPCADDGTTDARAADMCWVTHNAVLSLNGQSGELVKSGPDAWHLASDPGWRIQRMTQSSSLNGDNDGEYWIVTDQKGNRFFFGRGWDATGDSTDSVSTIPVSGDDVGDPCYSATASASFCDQAWRWNLDLVVDPHGVRTVIHYNQEFNNYGKMGSSTNLGHYARSSYPTRIDYGSNTSSGYVRRVLFTSDLRCAALGASCPTATAGNDSSYPDAPLDLQCSASPCTEHSPSFFSTRHLVSISAQALDTTWKTVDRWDLNQAFVDPDTSTTADDQEQALWLSSIQRVGAYSPSAGFGSTDTLPATMFSFVKKVNRFDYSYALGVLPMTLPRISQVRSELDGLSQVTYGQPDPCVSGSLPAPATTRRTATRTSPRQKAPRPGSVGTTSGSSPTSPTSTRPAGPRTARTPTPTPVVRPGITPTTTSRPPTPGAGRSGAATARSR